MIWVPFLSQPTPILTQPNPNQTQPELNINISLNVKITNKTKGTAHQFPFSFPPLKILVLSVNCNIMLFCPEPVFAQTEIAVEKIDIQIFSLYSHL